MDVHQEYKTLQSIIENKNCNLTAEQQQILESLSNSNSQWKQDYSESTWDDENYNEALYVQMRENYGL